MLVCRRSLNQRILKYNSLEDLETEESDDSAEEDEAEEVLADQDTDSVN